MTALIHLKYGTSLAKQCPKSKRKLLDICKLLVSLGLEWTEFPPKKVEFGEVEIPKKYSF